ncbi:dihydroorotate dehydrogenase-like protein [Saccharicrinis fermentans]|uniref:Dihydroorotate dehydrogenase B n=1 Tax=Saccharicrinis fermentans DSM 9555 = JCM 21142 TaxID=869213 RepID=W7Y7Z7_9BACT|nr:dihydroorotate dehydrogenase-like protein [Saccharicrinis fermentans]GAF04362.1 dihydroorotate dehydrogenase B [Saccharicrinis fermentans DSM 9555 = JCM 21142]
MLDLSTSYMGLKLKSPIIAAASGLTNSLQDIVELEKNGAGAVVLKSLFEEEIVTEMEHALNKMQSENHLYPETMEFYENSDVEDTLTQYLKLIVDCKQNTQIPIIASINCLTAHNWPYFAKSLEDAGADALELNISILPSDPELTSAENEKVYFDIINAVKKEVSIPISIKISPYFSNLAAMLTRFSNAGVNGIVLFNKLYSPDIDIESFDIIPANKFSASTDYVLPLRWVAIMSDRIDCDIAASTGIHDGQTLIKMLLAGASSVQVASTLYQNGFEQIQRMLTELKNWMTEKDFTTVEQIKGMLSQSRAINPAGYLRIQFMRHFAQK